MNIRINHREHGAHGDKKLLLSVAIVLLWVFFNFDIALADEPAQFGRLFFDAKTRAQLDESRAQYSTQRLNLPPIQETEEEIPTAIRMNGIIMRSDGSREVWINGTNTRDGSASELKDSVQQVGGNRVRVTVPGGEQVILKPGQSYSFDSRRVMEGYESDNKSLEQENAAASEPAPLPSMSKTGKPESSAEAETSAGFDESELAGQDTRIQLLEERLQKLEQSNDVKN